MSDHIPEDIQRLILDKLSSPRDHVRSSVVCKMWYSIYKKRTFPWFVLSDHDKENHTRGFFSLYDQKIYRLSAPELECKYIVGSSHGWLVTVDKEYAICLYEPFSKVRIQLPPILRKYKEISIASGAAYNIFKKIVLSCDPRTNPEGCVILCVSCLAIMYCRVGDKGWTLFPEEPPGAKCCLVEDVVFHKGNFLLVWGARVFICHLASGSESKPRITAFCPDMPERPYYAYLASVGGNVCVVNKVYSRGYQPVTFRIGEGDSAFVPISQLHFDVYKFDEENMTGWSKENDIGAQVLFLGYNESRALPASSFPNSYPNSIYYGDLHASSMRKFYMDKGIFDLKGRKIVLHYPRDNFDDMTLSPPLWLFQN